MYRTPNLAWAPPFVTMVTYRNIFGVFSNGKARDVAIEHLTPEGASKKIYKINKDRSKWKYNE
jgi:hypothetical protein